jgi:hypothetical protein
MNDIPDKLWQLLTDPNNKEFVDTCLKEVSRRIKEEIRKEEEEEKDRITTIEEIKRAVLESIKQNRELYKLLEKYDKHT